MATKSVKIKAPVKPRIRQGDTVMVQKGRESGKSGKVIRVVREKNAVLVQGLNYVKRHTRPNPQIGRQGGVMEKEAIIRLRTLIGFATAPPYTPECKSLFGPVTSTST